MTASALPPARSRRDRRGLRRLIVVLLVVTGIAGASALVAMARGGTSSDGTGPAAAEPVATDEVARRDLEETAEFDGTLAYRNSSELSLPAGGTVTALPEVGTVVGRGGSLLEVDGRPVVLLIGERPMWRSLGPGVGDGADVHQLEENLVALGVDGADELSVDEKWTSYTTTLVKRWQKSLGLPETGTIEPGDVVFRAAPARVAELLAGVGDDSGGSVLRVTGNSNQVTADVETNRRSLFEPGRDVEIRLPDRSTVHGIVEEVGDAVRPSDGQDSAKVRVRIAVGDDAAVEGLDQVPVKVTVVARLATDVLAVPVDALLALAGGGYAVEVVGQPSAQPELVAVELGMFADGWVEVDGELSEGDSVVVPR